MWVCIYIYNRYIHSYIHETSTVSAEAFAFCQSIEGIMLHMFWAFLILGGGCVSRNLGQQLLCHTYLYLYIYIYIQRVDGLESPWLILKIHQNFIQFQLNTTVY